MTTIGVLGGGQLGRMLGLAGIPLGLTFRFLDPSLSAPAATVGKLQVADFTDEAALREFSAEVDVVTYEFENVPVFSAQILARTRQVYPPVDALQKFQDRLTEKLFLNSLDIPTARFCALTNQSEVEECLGQLELPAILKTRRLGYDGKGQFRVASLADAQQAMHQSLGTEMILEGLVQFERELSILSARSTIGQIVHYPLIENHHRDGILSRSIAPAPEVSEALQKLAETYAQRVLKRLQYVGVLAIEFFQCGDQLIANEAAPRVHNSGHWSIEGAETSQFENHLRAILGLPLGSTACLPSTLFNCIGVMPDREAVLAVSGAHLHDYNKRPRAGRKVGHVTVCAKDQQQLKERVKAVEQVLLRSQTA